ncbi:hypothetical protein [Nocardia sp. NPDC005998]|uniref:hypothetical protein n=1 Tax=Nocardia sp. NPDC005998 TaxID=3156894 RepID=UPI0033A32C72
MTVMHSGPELPGDSAPGSSDVRMVSDAIGRFGHPVTRMLLGSTGFTMPALEAIVGAQLHVQVLRQGDVEARQIPATVTVPLEVSGIDRVLVRRSCLITADMVTASVNDVVAVRELAAASGIDDLHVPIGSGLISRGVSQRRRMLRAGLMSWPDGRPCAMRAYVMWLEDRPVCYVREAFNPDVIPADRSPLSGQ